MNCVNLDINREPDGLYFTPGDFWSIIQNPGDNPEVSLEVAREESAISSADLAHEVSPRELTLPPPTTSYAAMSGLPPVLSSHKSVTPNIVYTIPPPPSSEELLYYSTQYPF